MHARVGVVVVSYRNADLTLAALESVHATRWPHDALSVVLVDNASDDRLAARVRAELPDVHLIQSPVNRGFAGGCNLGIRALDPDTHVALVNSDAVVDPDWLGPLVAALGADPAIGAACPKILFAGEFGEVRFDVDRGPGHPGTPRDPDIRIAGARVDGVDVWDRVQWIEGDRGREIDATGSGARRCAPSTALRVPVGERAAAAELLLSSTTPARLVAGADRSPSLEVGPQPTWVRMPVGAPQRIVNNVGSELVADGYGADRGYLEVDDGRFDHPTDVFAWCGAAVLLRREYLDDVGLFDERLFLYYEDLELSWRGSSRGWRHRFVPESVVHHVHAATSVEGSERSDYFNERNHLAVVTRHGAPRLVVRAFVRHLLVTASYARRDLVVPLLRRRSRNANIVRRRLRAYGAALVMVPAMLRSRRRDRRASRPLGGAEAR